MFNDTKLETYPGIVVSGPDINPISPDSFVPVLTPQGLRIYIAGAAGAGALCKIVRPLYAGSTGSLVSSFNLTMDDGARLNQRLREFDVRVTDADGWTYPFDMQINWALGGMFQVATGVAAGKIAWQNTGIVFGVPAAGQSLAVSTTLSYDTTTHQCSILAVRGGTVSGNVPPAYQDQPAFQAGWQPNQVVRQHQLCLQNAGASSDEISGDMLSYMGT